MLKLIRKQDQAVVASAGQVAGHYFERLRGLIGKKEFRQGEALLFPKCNNIHMWMMSISIDVLFLKEMVPQREWKIVKASPGLKPWKLLPVGSMQASDALELPEGTIEKLNLKVGEVLCTA